MGKTCFLFGHRDAPESILHNIEDAAEALYTQHGIREFVVGSYGNYDRLAALALTTAKTRHKDITLRLLLPYHPAERPVTPPQSFDGTVYPEGLECVPRRYAIVRANQHMVRAADAIICFVQYPGNTQKLLELAQKRAEKGNLVLLNLVPAVSPEDQS